MDVIFNENNPESYNDVLRIEDMEGGDIFSPIGSDEIFFMSYEDGAFNVNNGSNLDYETYPDNFPVERYVGNFVVENIETNA